MSSIEESQADIVAVFAGDFSGVQGHDLESDRGKVVLHLEGLEVPIVPLDFLQQFPRLRLSYVGFCLDFVRFFAREMWQNSCAALFRRMWSFYFLKNPDSYGNSPIHS
jgi:hypothetical protein